MLDNLFYLLSDDYTNSFRGMEEKFVTIERTVLEIQKSRGSMTYYEKQAIAEEVVNRLQQGAMYQEIIALQGQVKTLEERLAQKSTGLSDADIDKIVAKLQANGTNLQDKVDCLTKDNQDLQSKVERLIQDKQDLQKQIDELKKTPRTPSLFELWNNEESFNLKPDNIQEWFKALQDLQGIKDYIHLVAAGDTKQAGFIDLFESYEEKLAEAIEDNQGEELDDIVTEILKVMKNYLFNSIIAVCGTRLAKQKNVEFVQGLVGLINKYLERAYFYTRKNLYVGKAYGEEDYRDIEQAIKDSEHKGKCDNEIVEINPYSYYINFQDEGGKQCKRFTKGKIVYLE